MVKPLKSCIFFLVVFILLTSFPSSCFYVFAQDNLFGRFGNAVVLYIGSPKAFVNGSGTKLDAENPEIVSVERDGHVMVPVRFLAEAFGGTVTWNEDENSALLKFPDKTVKMSPGSNIILIDGVDIVMSTRTEKISGRLYAPVEPMARYVIGKKIFRDHRLLVLSDDANILDRFDDKSLIDRLADRFIDIGQTIPVLMYHHFDENTADCSGDTTVTPAEFEENLQYLKSNGYNTIFFSDLYDYIKDKKPLPLKPLIITIDDGYESNYKYAYPLLKKYGMKATISVVVSSVGKTPGVLSHFTWSQAAEMEQSGVIDIQNHGLYHSNHGDMNEKVFTESVLQAQKEIEEHLGKRKVKVFTYPNGSFSENSRRILQTLGFDVQLTSLGGLVDYHTELSDIKRINISHGMTGKDIVDFIDGLSLTHR